MNKNSTKLNYKDGGVYFSLQELAKIINVVSDFAKSTHFNICDLQKYDSDALKKLLDTSIYEQIADINLRTAITFYGGENVRIYKSKKENGHYIYWRYCWGD